MTTSSLGYAVIQATDIAAWRKFGAEVLGLMPVEAADGGIRFRMDERPFRIAIVPGSEDRFVSSGWEMPNHDVYVETLKNLAAAGVAIEHGTDAEAADRKVRGLARCKDPSGNLLEIYHGRIYDYAPFVSPVGVSGFVTGNMGLGHVVLPAAKVEETRSFYKTHLGFGDTDEMRVPIGVPDHPGLALYFLHCDNPRHHSLALFEADIPGGLVHVMIEVKQLDDLGRCVDRCKKSGTTIAIDMGRHSNDLMVSSYIKTPSGFDVEYGWDGWQVDWSDYVPTKSEIFSLWGHPQMNGG
ncbi:MAG TPA: VOC family protein [Alphaproteobacteria bacterium]|jgi:3,4-dihydroxy-9,10-secoandrosta-1,3,5(10)-triene-9,17-dione 4,5-dioxygenase|nr:VOC family protein [Alphaproteobacteria bacterium]